MVSFFPWCYLQYLGISNSFPIGGFHFRKVVRDSPSPKISLEKFWKTTVKIWSAHDFQSVNLFWTVLSVVVKDELITTDAHKNCLCPNPTQFSYQLLHSSMRKVTQIIKWPWKILLRNRNQNSNSDLCFLSVSLLRTQLARHWQLPGDCTTQPMMTGWTDR